MRRATVEKKKNNPPREHEKLKQMRRDHVKLSAGELKMTVKQKTKITTKRGTERKSAAIDVLLTKSNQFLRPCSRNLWMRIYFSGCWPLFGVFFVSRCSLAPCILHYYDACILINLNIVESTKYIWLYRQAAH